MEGQPIQDFKSPGNHKPGAVDGQSKKFLKWPERLDVKLSPVMKIKSKSRKTLQR
jgi:hypothetical protein